MVDSKHQWKAWLYLAPAIILLLVFTAWPIVNTLRMAFLGRYELETGEFRDYGRLIDQGLSKEELSFEEDESFYFSETLEAAENRAYYTVSANAAEPGAIFLKNRASGKTVSAVITDIVQNGQPQKTILYRTVSEKESMPMKAYRLTGHEGSNGVYTLIGSADELTDGTYIFVTNAYGGDYALRNVSYGNGSQAPQPVSVSDGTIITSDTTIAWTVDREGNEITLLDEDEYFLINRISRDGKKFFFGFGNFAEVIKYNKFRVGLKNTVLLCVLTVPISTLLALLIAVGLNSIKPLQKLLQTIFFLPYVTNSIAIGMVFAAMFNIVGHNVGKPDELVQTAGIINNVIEFLGGTKVNWINQGSTYLANMTVMVVYIVWNALPFKILIILGGLQSINKQYYDAARVDGTSRSRILWRITVPLLSPILAYVIITGFIGGFKEYTSIVGIFGESRGPAGDDGRLNTIVGFVYDALPKDHLGRASAAALILFGIILLVTLLNLYVSKKKVHY